MSLGRPDPPFMRADHGDRLALYHGGQIDDRGCGRLAYFRPPGAQFCLLPEPFTDIGDFAADLFPPDVFVAQQLPERFLFALEHSDFFADGNFFELAQGPEPHIEDRFGLIVGQVPALHEYFLGLILLADDLDNLIEVEIDDHIAGQHLEAGFYFGQPVLGAPRQHFMPVIEVALQRLAQIHHPRHGLRIQDIQIERNTDLEIGMGEERLHHHIGIDGPVTRLEDEPDIGRRFIADILQHGQLARLHLLGDFFHQPALLDLVGHFGDHDLPLATRQLFRLPACPEPETAAPGPISRANILRRFHQHAAGREIRPRHEA